MDRQTIDFINSHADDDIRKLALKGQGNKDIDMSYALDQIAGRQTAKRKLPLWAAVSGIVYPQHLSMEQCSSQQTAQYKAAVADGLHTEERSFADLTGGFGVDFSFIARSFAKSTYVEQQQHLCAIASANFKLLGLDNVEVINDDGISYLQQMNHVGLIYLDPARRNKDGGRTFAISDCSPNVIDIKDLLLSKADYVMIKLSPMLDWRKTVGDLGSSVKAVHIVSVDNECKELVIVMSNQDKESLRVVCVNDGDAIEFISGNIPNLICSSSLPQPSNYIYEPNASIMKAGCFSLLEERYHVKQIGRNSHLFVSETLVEAFPGRKFKIDSVTTMNKKDLRKALYGISKANITVRNFPVTVADLRKRLKLSEGGDTYIFATTLADGSHVLLICSKIIY